MEREQATKFMYDLLRALLAKRGSDLFITANFPPAMKIDDCPQRSVCRSKRGTPLPSSASVVFSRPRLRTFGVRPVAASR